MNALRASTSGDTDRQQQGSRSPTKEGDTHMSGLIGFIKTLASRVWGVVPWLWNKGKSLVFGILPFARRVLGFVAGGASKVMIWVAGLLAKGGLMAAGFAATSKPSLTVVAAA